MGTDLRGWIIAIGGGRRVIGKPTTALVSADDFTRLCPAYDYINNVRAGDEGKLAQRRMVIPLDALPGFDSMHVVVQSYINIDDLDDETRNDLAREVEKAERTRVAARASKVGLAVAREMPR